MRINAVALKILPLNAAGICYLLADKPELAEPHFKKCVDAMPKSHIFRRRFTECLIRQDKKSEALAAFADYYRKAFVSKGMPSFAGSSNSTAR